MPIEVRPPISARGLSKTFPGDTVALDGVDLEVGGGEVIGLLGPNGSGKSTLLAILAGSLRPDRGLARIFGAPPGSEPARGRTGYAPQEQALDPEMTSRETALLLAGLHGFPAADAEAAAGRALREFGLEDHDSKPVAALSGGLRQRLHLLLESLHAPGLLLLDEPTRGLDLEGRACLWHWVARHAGSGAAALFALHDPAEVELRCSRALLLSRGRILADGAPASLAREQGRWSCRAALGETSSGLAARLEARPDVERVAAEPGALTWWVAGEPDLAAWLGVFAGWGAPVASIERRPPDLASVYRRLLGEDPDRAGGDLAGMRARRRHAR